MNPIELACVRGHSELLTYYINELNIQTKVEFNVNYETLSIEQMPFIFVPIVTKNAEVFKILLNISNLWSYNDLKEISIFLKQIKWREGYQIFFRTISVHQ